jgi:sugar-specific transcriptional regulator TrmB
MYIHQNYAALLGFTAQDLDILNALDTQMNISELAERLKIPRTSLYSMLSNLKRRGFIETVIVGKRKEWRAVQTQRLAAHIGELYSSMQNVRDTKGEKVSLVTSRNTGFVLHKGKEHLVRLYKRMLDLHKSERLLILQPNQSTEIVMAKFPKGEMNNINKYIQKNKIIVEAIIHENAIPHYVESMKKIGATKEHIREAFSAVNNRVADTTYIPKEYLTVKSEVYIMNDVALIMNWEEEVGIEIKNSDMVGMLKEMFTFIKSHGTKVDQNPMIQKLLETLE